MILLDTYTLIGLYSEPQRLSATAKSLVEDSEIPLFVSAISSWEICIAVQKRRLVLEVDPILWFEKAITKHSVQVLDVTWRIAANSTRLPRHHADPADRIIIATAIDQRLRLLTPEACSIGI